MDSVLVLVMLGAVLSGFVLGLTGSNFGLVAMAVWTWVLEPVVMAPMIVCGAMVGHLLAARSLPWQRVKSLLGPMALGGVIGVPLGVWLLLVIDKTWFSLAVGVLLTGWCSLMLMSKELPRISRGGPVANALVGSIGGVMSGLGGIPGPAPALWAVFKGWDRDTQRTVVQGFNLTMQSTTLVAFMVAGAFSGNGALEWLPLVIACVIPSALAGMWIYRRVSDQIFSRLVLALLVVSGLLLTGMSLPKLL